MASRLFQARSIGDLALDNLAFILTDRCNFDCSYCYERRGTQRLAPAALARAIDVLHPFLAQECVVSFYGGEPLLEFDLIRHALEKFRVLPGQAGQTIRFSITTNGSLLDDEILGFLADNRFSISLSFDGLAQDISRKRGSYDLLASLIPGILANPQISLETISVFSADTVGYLSASVKLLVEMGVPELDILFAHVPRWSPAALRRLETEISRVSEFFASRYEDLLNVPWAEFREAPRKAVRCCPAGADRLAVSAQGTLWGCAVFPHFLRERYGASGCQDYCFGDIETFAKDPEKIYAQKIAAYTDLRMDRFSTPERSCGKCDDVESCWICPLAAGLTTGEIGKVSKESCRRAKILRRAKRRLREGFEARARRRGKSL